MDAIIINVKGDLKPIALRHHVFEIGNTLGIHGFLNYRNGMYELLVHAEGENDVLDKFRNQIIQLVKEYKLVCSMESVGIKDFTGFKISHLDVTLNHNFVDCNKSLNPDNTIIEIPTQQVTEQNYITTDNKRRKSVFIELFSFLKHAGLW